jgi:hypothetical protein
MRRHVAQQTVGAAAAAAHTRFADPLLTGPARLARTVVGVLGGRFSAELGIDVDAGDAEVERWFLAATFSGRGFPPESRSALSRC